MGRILTDTGERFRGLPVMTLGSPEVAAAQERRDNALEAMLRAHSNSLEVTAEMEAEYREAKAELFRLKGWKKGV